MEQSPLDAPVYYIRGATQTNLALSAKASLNFPRSEVAGMTPDSREMQSNIYKRDEGTIISAKGVMQLPLLWRLEISWQVPPSARDLNGAELWRSGVHVLH